MTPSQRQYLMILRNVIKKYLEKSSIEQGGFFLFKI